MKKLIYLTGQFSATNQPSTLVVKSTNTTCAYGEQKPQGNWCSMCGIHQKLTSFVLYPVQRCTGHFSPHKNTVTGITYLDMVSEWPLPQMQQHSENVLFIQDGAPLQNVVYFISCCAPFCVRMQQQWLNIHFVAAAPQPVRSNGITL